MIAASSGSGPGLVTRAGPGRAEAAGELLRARITGAREGKHGAPLPRCELADHVRGGAEAVEAEAAGVAGHRQRAVPDQSATQQGRRLLVTQLSGERQAEALIRDGQLREAAVDVAPGEARVHTQVLAPGAAVCAVAIGPAEPRDTDTATVLGNADDLVPENDRQLRRVDLTVTQMQVGSADATRVDTKKHLVWLEAQGPAASSASVAGAVHRARRRA